MTEQLNIKKYDRQIRTYGLTASNKITQSTVYLYGLEGGLGTEVAKNITLTGVNKLVLIDKNRVDQLDIEFGYFYTEDDKDKNRVDVLQKKLFELNSSIKIECCNNNFNFSLIDDNSTVVLTNISCDEAIEINNIVREKGCKTVFSNAKGLGGLIFVDVQEHIVFDLTDNIFEPIEINNISKFGKIECDNHPFEIGDKIKFTDVKGKNLDFFDTYWKVNSKTRNSFTIVSYDFNIFPKRDFIFTNGICNYVSVPKTIVHNSLEYELGNLTIENDDKELSKVIIETILSFKDSLGMSYFDETKKLFQTSVLELAPVNSIIGGLVSTEVIKCVTNKYTPITQWMTYHDFDLIPKEKYTDNGSNQFSNHFGEELLDKLRNINIGMVGCGALGCEWLKNLALMGCGTKGNINVTDPDHIEKSNLSRQFLFRDENIGMSKSSAAKSKINDIYPKCNIESFNQMVSNDNKKFVDKFFSDKDIIINALDNTKSRRYVDSLCFNNNIALFESGTMGMKGNTQPVIPYMTETYSNSVDPPESKEYPLCTIKSFPTNINHTISWARDKFEFFTRAPTTVNNYIENPKYLNKLNQMEKNTAINDLNNFLHTYKCSKWEDCCKWAIDICMKEFNHDILQLLHCFPKDHMINDEKFWSKNKKCPSPLNIGKSYEFIFITTKLLCECNIIKDTFSIKDVKNYIQNSDITYNFTPKNVNIPKTDSEIRETISKETEILFDKTKIEKKIYFVQNFDKENDGHIKWIKEASNNRAKNYGIKEEDEYKTKGIVGNIIPAVISTTSTIVGLICMELYKYLQNSKKYNSYFLNMSNNIFVKSEPLSAPLVEVNNIKFNSWDKLDFDKNKLLASFIEFFEKKFKICIMMILCDCKIVYSKFIKSDINMSIKDILISKKLTGKDNNLQIITDDNSEIPLVNLKN